MECKVTNDYKRKNNQKLISRSKEAIMARKIAVKFYSSDPSAYDGPGWYIKIMATDCILGPFDDREEAEAELEEIYQQYYEPSEAWQRRL